MGPLHFFETAPVTTHSTKMLKESSGLFLPFLTNGYIKAIVTTKL
jgi:hypothetical protein